MGRTGVGYNFCQRQSSPVLAAAPLRGEKRVSVVLAGEVKLSCGKKNNPTLCLIIRDKLRSHNIDYSNYETLRTMQILW
jgi:hypothetical protein